MTPEFEEVFAALKAIMKKYERTLFVLKDEPQEYTLATKSNSNRGMKMWFGSVRAGKAYVSYHLMPLYFNPVMNAGSTVIGSGACCDPLLYSGAHYFRHGTPTVMEGIDGRCQNTLHF